MKLALLGWSSSGLRCPDVVINLLPSGGSTEPHKVTLLQMPNGTGKTTTLNLLRAALTGTAKHWSPEEVAIIRRPGATNANGDFELRLALDGVRLTFRLAFDFGQGIVTYTTQYQSHLRP